MNGAIDVLKLGHGVVATVSGSGLHHDSTITSIDVMIGAALPAMETLDCN